MKASSFLRLLSPSLCVLLLLLLTFSARAADPVLVAEPSTVVLKPNGPTSGDTNILWDANNNKYNSARMYMRVDNKDSQIGSGRSGSKIASISLGKTYTFTLYSDSSKKQTLASITVMAKLEEPPTKPSPNIPTKIGRVQVYPNDHQVMITFDAAPNQIPVVSIGKNAPTRGSDGLLGIRGGGDGFLAGGNGAYGKIQGHYIIGPSPISQLEPNTHYFFLIDAVSGGRREQVQGEFVTRSQKAIVTWDSVHVLNDSDPMGSGEISCWFWVNYGQPTAQGFEIGERSVSDGHWNDIKRSVTIENSPDILNLSASGSDSDSLLGLFTSSDISAPVKGPEDQGSQEVNVANGTFDLSRYSGNDVTLPFTLRSMEADGGGKGDLMFEVTGTIHIIRGNIGSTSSPLQIEPKEMWETTPIAPVGPALFATFIYGLWPDGTLVWWRHDGAEFGSDKWQGPRKVGTNWRFKKIIPGGGNIIYGITEDGKLIWLNHTGFNTGDGLNDASRIQPNSASPPTNNGASVHREGNGRGGRDRFRPNGFVPEQAKGAFMLVQRKFPLPIIPPDGQITDRIQANTPNLGRLFLNAGWEGPVEIASGWDKYKQVFGGGNGVIYALTGDGTLLWFRRNPLMGAGATLEGPKTIARDCKLKHLFSAGNGIIYGVGPQGELMRAKHLGIDNGSESWLMTNGAIWQQVDTGWDKYDQIFSSGLNSPSVPKMQRGSLIYAVDKQGKLWWRNHLRPDANGLGRGWYGPKDIGRNLKGYKQIISLMPLDLPAGTGIH